MGQQRTSGLAALAIGLIACSPAPESKALTWHKDVAPIVQRKCATCHVTGGVAPFPLGTLAEWKAVESAALVAIGSGKMPPFPGRTDCAEYDPSQSISAAQKTVIQAWAEGGDRKSVV